MGGPSRARMLNALPIRGSAIKMMGMKKTAFLGLLPILMSFPLLASCSEAEIGLTPLTYGMVYDASLDIEEQAPSFLDHAEAIDHPSLGAKIERKESFLLLIYDPNTDCTCWDALEATLTTFQKNYDALIYTIDPDEFAGRDAYGLKIVEGEETFAIFKRGALKEQRVTKGAGDDFAEYRNFEAYLSERVSMSSMKRVSATNLKEILSASSSALLVYFGRESCSDCAYVESSFLYDYLEGSHLVSYRVECDAVGIRYQDEEAVENGEVDESLWQSFKDSYGLSETLNDGLGYGRGFVPSFLVYNPGSASDIAELAIDMCVPYNEVLVANGDGTHVISDSFYSKERLMTSPYFQDSASEYDLIGKEIPEDEVLSGRWDVESSSKVHSPRLAGFLDAYLTE